jgi:hypothetical protein
MFFKEYKYDMSMGTNASTVKYQYNYSTYQCVYENEQMYEYENKIPAIRINKEFWRFYQHKMFNIFFIHILPIFD